MRGAVQSSGGVLGTARKNLWSFLSLRRNQQTVLEQEVSSLKDEIHGVEIRESTLQVRLDHLDSLLRSAEIACYLFTRLRWAPLPGEEAPPLDDSDVNDWVQRFLVFQNSTIGFYLRATDLRPQVTIQMHDIVEAGKIPADKHHTGDKSWFAFHVTTCYGLRLECSTLHEHQLDAWLRALASLSDDQPISNEEHQGSLNGKFPEL
ncbi:uncharacterized protein LOC112349240 isoform X1 [Selaginella moellendorffii]|uniref:uncharacterized protein LOC112349240 isoform X1 n=1 Tax=Selaginella moellendorffii TaxID=88036 RepID=UPI000D1C8532|nr:uncharacterized protein LOC112349240 isoform X1 [Selaginella moellendorffii]|eukprot:XP_024539063.1 uncharacterized protein LOC112349240 isoform X1 [Selaginella moellendorffii]